MSGLKKIYEKKNGSRLSLLVYLAFFAVNAVIGLCVNYMSLEGEFTSAASAAVFLGRSWYDVMPSAASAADLIIRGIVYLPFMLICSEPVLQYKLFLVFNAALYALIPMIAYKTAIKAGVEKSWQRLVICIVCGIYPGVLMSSHFASGTGFSSVFVWLVILILFKSENEENTGKAGRFVSSVCAGLATAGAFFTCESCIAIFISVCVYLIYLHFTHKNRPVYISVYAVTFILLAGADTALSILAQTMGIYTFSGGFYQKVISAVQAIGGGKADFGLMLCGRLYYFVTSSWGLATAAFAFIAFAAAAFYRSRKNGNNSIYNESFILPGLFCCLAAILIIPADAFLSLSEGSESVSEIISSAAVFTVVLPLVLLFFIFIFRYGIEYMQLIAAIAVTALFSFPAVMALKAYVGSGAEVNPLLSGELVPLRPGLSFSAELDSGNIFYPICMVFVVFAVIIPVVCCTRKHSAKITAFICGGLTLYSAIYTGIAVLVSRTVECEEYPMAAVKIESSISSYAHDSHTPVIAVYNADEMLAMNLQYTMQNAKVKYVDSQKDINDSCYVVSSGAIAYDGLCVLIGRTDGINIYAVGNNAVKPNTEPDRESVSDSV